MKVPLRHTQTGAIRDLPDDCMSNLVGFLQPGEFYSLRGAGVCVPEQLYWGERAVPNLVEMAINHDCVSAFRYSVIECDMRLSHSNVVRILVKNRLRRYQKYVYRYSMLLYNNLSLLNSCILCKNNRVLLDELVDDRSWQPTPQDCRYLLDPTSMDIQWQQLGTPYDRYASFVRLCGTGMYDIDACALLCVEYNMDDELEYLLRRNMGINPDTVDLMYEHRRWRMVAQVFRYTPKLLIDYLFGNYRNPTDPYMIQETRVILQYMRKHERCTFVTVLEKYHNWLWRFLLHRSNTLGTIDAIIRLELFEFRPNVYMEAAMASPHRDYLQYLVTRGATINMDEVYLAARYNHRYSAILYNHLVTCNRNEILIVMTFITMVMVALLLKNKNTKGIEHCTPRAVMYIL